MIKISELLSLEVFEKFNIIAGENGLNNMVGNIGILEYETEENMEKTFTKGDFVITTLFFANGDSELLERTLIRLMDLRISGMAIKNIYEYEIPQSVLDHATERAVPIFTFEDMFFEDIIISVTDALRVTTNQSYFEDRVNSIIKRQANKNEIRETAYDINSSFSKNIIAAYCIEKNYENDRTIMRILETIRLRKYRSISSIKNSIFKYDNGIMIIHSFEENEEAEEADEIDVLTDLIDKVGIDRGIFHVGIGDIHNSLEELDICIRKSIYAIDACIDKAVDILKFEEIGLNRFFLPLKEDYWVGEYCKSIITKIVQHDEKYGADLMKTLVAYIDNRGEMASTAKELFQHVNTIRYRLEKIRSITGISKTDDFYEQMFIAVRFYKLNN
jgi:sugar diacid utilization regulator